MGRICLFLDWVFFKSILKIKRTLINWYINKKLDWLGVERSCSTFNGFVYLFIEKGAEIILGENFIMQSGPSYTIDAGVYSKIEIKKGAKLIIGNNVGVSSTSIHVHNEVSIGDNVNIGSGCLIMDTDFHSLSSQIRLNRDVDMSHAKTVPVTIGDNVFIGAHCVIGKGISIGSSSIIAAGSVVVKSIPESEIWGGNPARFIRKI